MPYDIGYYDIGDDVEELLGYDDDDDEVGAIPWAKRQRALVKRRPSGKPMSRALQMALAQRQAKSMPMLTERELGKPRQYPLGFDSVATVAAGATTTITSRPQVLFTPERLVLSSAAAPAFLINDLIVGKNSQFAASGSLPGDAFGPTAFGVRLRCDTAQVSNDVVLDVTNISAGALRFTAALFGDVVE